MTTETRNEAAERLRSAIQESARGDGAASGALVGQLSTLLENALSQERRATVERLVGAIPTMEWVNFPDSVVSAFRGEGWPFDEEAAR